MKGRVKWFNNKYGYGFIISEDGEDIFVHYSGINGIPMLEENEKVTYDLAINELDGKQRAVNVEKEKEKKSMTEKDFHSCKLLDTIQNISVQKINGSWLWCFWDDKKRNTAHGIRNCPYCGKLLQEDEGTRS